MIVQKSSQNVNSNAGVFLGKQLLDRMGGFSRFDGWQKAARSVPCQHYSNSSLVKAQVALMALGKTTFSDIAAHQQDDLFADADTVVRFYHEHATHEQFHSELKMGLDVERLPSESFAVNELVLALSTLSFNILRIIGQTALEVRGETGGVSRLRLRTVLLNYIYVGAICGSHGGRRYLRLGRNCHVADVFMAIGARLAA